MSWAVVPAAGRGARFGGEVPKQYADLLGRPLIAHALSALASHAGVEGIVVALAADDPFWPGWQAIEGKPLRTTVGGAERADSVRAGLAALPGAVGPDDVVLVHDAARPCLSQRDLDRLLARAGEPAGAILAAPVRDTIKRSDADRRIVATEPREALWRALTPQMFPRGLLERALDAAARDRVAVTDEAMAVERLGLHPALVEGSADNLKVTDAADLALAAFVLSQRRRATVPA